MKARILAACGALISAVGFGVGSGGPAYAQSGYNQYCNNGYCLNGWGGGPYVNAYTINVVNNNFEAFQNSSGYENIVYTGPGDTGQCISDYGNSSSDARAGLGGQCQSGQIDWGANFQLKACSDGGSGWAFKNVHWGGWLTPNSDSDGSPFYLNSATETCYQVYGEG
jgi:hypothetical protein